MHRNTFTGHSFFIVMIFFHIATIVFFSCKKENDNLPAPVIWFSDASGCVNKDTTLLIGDMIHIGIIAESNGTDDITQLHYEIQADSLYYSVDSGFHSPELHYFINIEKGIAETEIWTFQVSDRQGRRSNIISIKFSKDSASLFGNIIHIPSLTLGAQDNGSTGSFYGFETGLVYTQNEAFAAQQMVDILYFYDYSGDENTIASPNANVDANIFPAHAGGDTLGMINWPVRNVTRYEQLTSLNIAEFDACSNDSLLLANTFVFPTGKRKAKILQPGDLYAFILHDETTKGIFRVKEVNGTNLGTISIEIKIQDFND